MAREQASIGAAQHYGPREANTGLDNQVSTYGLTRQRELYFDYEQAQAGLPTTDADTDAGTLIIPANSLIKKVYLEVSTAFASGTPATDTVLFGLQQTDGTVIDADGLIATGSSNPADLTVGWIEGDGALVGASVGTADAQISIDVGVGTLTAGVGRLVVEYIEPTAA